MELLFETKPAGFLREVLCAPISQEETAGKLGVSRQTISKWELNALLVLKDMLAAAWRRRKTGARRGD